MWHMYFTVNVIIFVLSWGSVHYNVHVSLLFGLLLLSHSTDGAMPSGGGMWRDKLTTFMHVTTAYVSRFPLTASVILATLSTKSHYLLIHIPFLYIHQSTLQPSHLFYLIYCYSLSPPSANISSYTHPHQCTIVNSHRLRATSLFPIISPNYQVSKL